MPRPLIQIVQAQSALELDACRRLFIEYVREEQVPSACLGNFDLELASLADVYAPPNGALFLASVDEAYAGCCALCPLHGSDYPNAAEMRRLYVAAAFRGLGIGRDLCQITLEAAQVAGYDSVLLDTLDAMEGARALYQEFGFYEIAPHRHMPEDVTQGAVYLKVDL